VKHIEQQFRLHYESLKTDDKLAETLFNKIYPTCDFTFLYLQHPEHAVACHRN